MRARLFAPLAAALAIPLVFSACADSPTISGLRPIEQQQSLVGELLMSPLLRTTALAEPVSWSFVAGPAGVTSSNSATGLTISVPKNALASNVTITVTAVDGSAVAYAFEPHGLQFAKDVQLTQSLRNTNVGLLNVLLLQGGHFTGTEPSFNGPLALVTETSAARLNLLSNSMSFPIRHFSGWIAGSGRSSSTSDVDGY